MALTDKNYGEELSVDICILGAAGAGLCAAVRAKECGANKILVLEKMKKVGGCTELAAGFFPWKVPCRSV
jgi:succinate dehydrogenase/fumarate reductase flavoprotein subunit